MNSFYGNGAATSKASPSAPNSNNFGLGLLGVSQNNLVESNKIGGNINGVYLGGGGQVTGNIIRRNTIAGNPPVQVSIEFKSAIGADIQNFAPAGTNKFDENYCLTYAGPGPSPCPNISEHGNGKDQNGDNEDRQDSAKAGFRAAPPFPVAFKPANIGFLFNDLWALLRPAAAPNNARRSRQISDALSNQFAGQ